MFIVVKNENGLMVYWYTKGWMKFSIFILRGLVSSEKKEVLVL